MASSAQINADRFLADRDAPLCSLNVAKSFTQLRRASHRIRSRFSIYQSIFRCSVKEKLYAHHFTQAAWAGARIIQSQWTPHADRLFDFLILTFSHGGKLADLESLKSKSGLSDQAWDDLLQYTIQVRCVLDASVLVSQSPFIF
jgi:dipeptidyl-peptidase-3